MAQYENPKEVTQENKPKEDVAVDHLSPEDLAELKSQLASGDTLVLDGGKSAEWLRYDLDFAEPLGKNMEKEVEALSDTHLVVRVRGGGQGRLTFPKNSEIKAYKVMDSNNQVTYHIYGKGADIYHLMKSAVYVAPDIDAVQFQTVIYGKNQAGEPDALAQRFFVLQQEATSDETSLMTMKMSGRAQLPDLPEDVRPTESFDRPTFGGDEGLTFKELQAFRSGDAIDRDPEAIDDRASTPEDVPVLIDVLANDFDPDGKGLTIVDIVTDPEHGTVKIVDGKVLYTPDENYNGPDSFVYTMRDADGDRDVAKVVVNVTPVNDPPVAIDDGAQTKEDVPVTIDILKNDSDPDGDTIVIKNIDDPKHGTVEIVNGKAVYTPDKDFNGKDVFTYEISDGKGGGDTAKVTVIVTPENDNPIAADDDKARTPEDVPVLIDVLANDKDPDGDVLVITSVGDPKHGKAEIKDGKVLYTPDLNYNGKDSFVYTIADGKGGVAQAKVTVDVIPDNDAPGAKADPIIITQEDTPVTTDLDIKELFVDPEGDPVSIKSIAKQPENGSVTLSDDGKITYSPDANYFGSDKLVIIVTDGDKDAFVTVDLVVEPVNDAPLAIDDASVTKEDTAVTIDALANDSDPVERSAVTLTGIEGKPLHGTAEIKNGKIVYTPDANYVGTDSFTYKITDAEGGTDTATVKVNVGSENDAPKASDDKAVTNEDVPVSIDVAANDVDPDGDDLTPTVILTQPKHGVAVIKDGQIVYTPNKDYHGTDQFTYRVEDGKGGSDEASVEVLVKPLNDAPKAADDSASTGEDTAVTVDVLANDKDPDGDNLQIVSVGKPGHGSVDIKDGKVIYTPDKNFQGSDSFTYKVSDGKGGESTAQVRINVASENDAPLASPDAAKTEEDQAVRIDVLKNDSDPDGDDLSVTALSDPLHGRVEIKDGVVVYTPDKDFSGNDSFTYTASDGSSTSQATVTVEVSPLNDAPVALDDAISGLEERPIRADVLANDSDPDGDKLTLDSIVNGPAHGSAVIKDGAIVYTSVDNYNGQDVLTYRVADGKGGFDTAELRITVGAVNDAPAAVDDKAVTDEDQSVTVDVLANDSDADGPAPKLQGIDVQPDHGTVIVKDGKLIYTPDADFTGTDTFRYSVTDGLASDSATVTILVKPLNDAPVATDDTISLEEDVNVTFNVLLNDKDVDGDTLRVDQILTDPKHGVIVSWDKATGEVVYNPDANYNGKDSFTYQISDGHGGFDTAHVHLNIGNVNDNPAADPDDIFINN